MNRLLIILLVAALGVATGGWAQRAPKPRRGGETTHAFFFSKDKTFFYNQTGKGAPRESVVPAEAAESLVLFYPDSGKKPKKPGKLRFFPKAKMSLVIGELDENRVVRNAFIEELDLQELAAWLREHYFPNKAPFPVHFYNCLIGRVVNSNATPDLQVAFDSELIFEEVSIQSGQFSLSCPGIQFINTDLHQTRFFNCRFGKFEFIRSYIAQNEERSAFNNYELYDSAAYGRYKVFFQDCVFRQRAFMASSALERLCFSHCEFLDSVFFRPNPHYLAKLVRQNRNPLARSEQGQVYVSNSQLPVKQNPYVLHANFEHTTFSGAVSVAGMRLDSCRFNNTSFNHSLDLTHVQANTQQYFNRCHFKEEMPFAIDVTNRSIDSLHLNLQELPRLAFNLVGLDATAMTRRDLTQSEEFFNALTGYVTATQVSESEKKDALDHLAYERGRYRARFYGDNWARDDNAWAWVKHRLLGAVVRNGYHGHWRLFWVSVGVVFLFSLLYAVPKRYRREVLKIVHEKDSPAERRAALLSHRKGAFPMLRDYLTCLFFSFTLFVRPTFPPAYLNERRGLLTLIFVEYCISLGLLLVFLMFIAPELPFVKTLLHL